MAFGIGIIFAIWNAPTIFGVLVILRPYDASDLVSLFMFILGLTVVNSAIVAAFGESRFAIVAPLVIALADRHFFGRYVYDERWKAATAVLIVAAVNLYLTSPINWRTAYNEAIDGCLEKLPPVAPRPDAAKYPGTAP
jgi:hypothetical protein